MIKLFSQVYQSFGIEVTTDLRMVKSCEILSDELNKSQQIDSSFSGIGMGSINLVCLSIDIIRCSKCCKSIVFGVKSLGQVFVYCFDGFPKLKSFFVKVNY